MSGYTPLFGEIVTSSIWNEDDKTRIVWITMLALADARGVVEASVAGLAPVARVSLEDCIKAVERLKSPDSYSRTKEFEGRRIEEIEGGWLILNYEAFRKKASKRTAEYYRRWRMEKAQQKRNKKRNYTYTYTNTDINTDTNTNTNTKKEKKISVELLEEFEVARKLYPGNKRGRDTELANLMKQHKDWRGVIPALEPAIELQIARREEMVKNKEFVPPWKHFKTYINSRSWESKNG